MTPEQHTRLMEHFDATCESSAAEQSAYLARLAEEDAAVAHSLAGMLRHDRVLPPTGSTWAVARTSTNDQGDRIKGPCVRAPR